MEERFLVIPGPIDNEQRCQLLKAYIVWQYTVVPQECIGSTSVCPGTNTPHFSMAYEVQLPYNVHALSSMNSQSLGVGSFELGVLFLVLLCQQEVH